MVACYVSDAISLLPKQFSERGTVAAVPASGCCCKKLSQTRPLLLDIWEIFWKKVEISIFLFFKSFPALCIVQFIFRDNRVFLCQNFKSNRATFILEPYIHRWFGETYTRFILRKDVLIISWILFFAYALLAIYGCTTIKVDISPKKYIRDNSPIQPFVYLAGDFFSNETLYCH